MGIPTLISTATPSNTATVSITSGIDSTYDEYMFVFTDIGPATNNVSLTFQCNATDSTSYDETMTTTFFDVQHFEDDSGVSGPAYRTDKDQAQGTAFNFITNEQGNGADESGVAIMHLFNPASTTYVKHFYLTSNNYRHDDKSCNYHIAGYINTTTAIDDIQFKMSSGNFDGVIQMYGIA